MSLSPESHAALSHFADVANEYLDFIDNLCIGRPAALYTKLEALLPKLHMAILPISAHPEFNDLPEYDSLRLTHEDWKTLASAIQRSLNGDGMKLFEYHGGTEDKTDYIAMYRSTRAEMLWDDLADIYCDLHEGRGLWRLNNPNAQSAAAWNWRFNFEHHWGHHLAKALVTIHESRYSIHLD